MLRTLVALLAGAIAVQAAPTRRAGVPPLSDGFYTPPSNLSLYKNGEVVRTRQFTPSLGSGLPLVGATKAYHIGYRTSNWDGSPGYTVTSVFIPAKAQPNLLVSYSAPYDSSYENCVPSYTYSSASGQQGWTVTSADYEGYNATFTSGRTTGHGTLDGIRATLNAGSLVGLNKSQTLLAVNGYSGGGLSSGWANALLSSYAPELVPNFRAFAFGGTPANLSSVVQYLENGIGSGFVFSGLAGLSKDYASLRTALQQVGTPALKEAIDYASNHCSSDVLQKYGMMSVETTKYNTLGDQILYYPPVKSVLDTLVLGSDAYASETPVVPTFVTQCTTDEIIPVDQADKMISQWCKHGAPSIVYERDIGGCEHISEVPKSLPAYITFIADRFAGKPAVSGCSISSVAIPTPDPTALGVLAVPLVESLLALPGSGVLF